MPDKTDKTFDEKAPEGLTTQGDEEAAAQQDAALAREEYDAAMRELMANKEQFIREVERLGRQSAGVTDETDDGGDKADEDAGSAIDRDIGDGSDSGHIADIISEDGEDISGAVLWSSSGRKFVLMSADGKPISDLEADQATELVNSRRLAFDGAKEQEYFVSKMSSVGVDVDRDRIDLSSDGSTGELLVTPENLIGNERHHISGEHAGENVEWTDEVDLSDPESTGPQRVEEIISAQAKKGAGPDATAHAGGPRVTKRKISGQTVYRADNIMTFLAVFIIVVFYILVLAFQQLNAFMLGVWSVLCVTCTTAILMPFTMSMETREKNLGGKFMLTGSLCIMFLVMSGFLLADALANGRRPWGAQDAGRQIGQVEGGEPEPSVILDFEPSGDIVPLETTGGTKTYSTVAIGNVLVTTSEAGKANSLVSNVDGKKYVTQVVATIDGLGVSAFTVESSPNLKPITLAKSLSIGQSVIVYSTGSDGSVSVEGTTIRSTTFPVGTRGLPEPSEVDQVFVNKSLIAGDIVMDAQGRLIGIAAVPGDGVVTGTSISKAVNVLTSDDNDLYIGIVCRQASVSENKDGGAYVENVMTNSPASNAGIMTGDIVVSVDGNDVAGTDDLDAFVGRHGAGEQVSLGIIRNGNEVDLTVTIGRHGGDGTAPAPKGDDGGKPVETKDVKTQETKQVDPSER